QSLRRNLEDLAWLEACARAHHHVIDAIARRANVLPMGLAVVYHDDDRVRATLDGRQSDFKAALRQVAGRTEWGVKASALLDDRRASEPRHDGTSHRAVDRPGTEYLLQRRANLSAR